MEDQGTENENEIAVFSFRGFKGDYDIKLMDGDNELKSWTLNLDKDSEWVLEYWSYNVGTNYQSIKYKWSWIR